MEELTEQQIRDRLDPYINSGRYTNDQILELREGIKDGLNVDTFANPDMPASQMARIRKDLFAQKKEYDEKQEEIRKRQEALEQKNLEYEKEKRKQTTRETAYIALVLFAISMICMIMKLIKLF